MTDITGQDTTPPDDKPEMVSVAKSVLDKLLSDQIMACKALRVYGNQANWKRVWNFASNEWIVGFRYMGAHEPASDVLEKIGIDPDKYIATQPADNNIFSEKPSVIIGNDPGDETA